MAPQPNKDSTGQPQNEIASVIAALASRQGDHNRARKLTGPERAAVLMPRQGGAAIDALGEEHRAVEGDRSLDEGAGDALEERVGHPGAKQGIELELLQLAIVG